MGNAGMAGSGSPSADPALEARRAIEARAAKRGADWFYWVAGLSAVNSIVTVSGGNWHFLIGLGASEVFDAAAKEGGEGGRVVALVLSLLIAGIFAFFGFIANKRKSWGFFIGMGLYALDGLLLISFGDYPSAAFHALALYYIFRGLAASQRYAALRPANAPLG